MKSLCFKALLLSLAQLTISYGDARAAGNGELMDYYFGFLKDGDRVYVKAPVQFTRKTEHGTLVTHTLPEGWAKYEDHRANPFDPFSVRYEFTLEAGGETIALDFEDAPKFVGIPLSTKLLRARDVWSSANTGTAHASLVTASCDKLDSGEYEDDRDCPVHVGTKVVLDRDYSDIKISRNMDPRGPVAVEKVIGAGSIGTVTDVQTSKWSDEAAFIKVRFRTTSGGTHEAKFYLPRESVEESEVFRNAFDSPQSVVSQGAVTHLEAAAWMGRSRTGLSWIKN